MKTSEMLREIANHRLAANEYDWCEKELAYTTSFAASVAKFTILPELHELDTYVTLMETSERQAIRFMGLHFLAHMYEDEGD